MPADNITLCDTKGVIYQGRETGMNQWKAAHAIKTEDRTLGRSGQRRGCVLRPVGEGCADQGYGRLHGRQPDHFAMANPAPEITPEEVAEVREDAIVATGRSDYPNQVNNVLGFPYIFRGALDVRATTINDAMKIAAANALAEVGARGCARRGGLSLSRHAPALRAELHHSGAVRSAP
jgi:malate dehydrogenase (oxaloacetate-decarboxylating)(NADP+)